MTGRTRHPIRFANPSRFTSGARRRARWSQADALEARRLLSTFTVNSLTDVTNANDGVTTLREAIVVANAHAGADTINFSAAAFSPGSLHTIALTGGELKIADTTGGTTVAGPGAPVLAISGACARPS
jgi:CSLREA domain-containing protein